MKSLRKFALECAGMLILSTTSGTLYANQLTVTNPGFEDNPGFYRNLTGWTTFNFSGYPIGGADGTGTLSGQLIPPTGTDIGYESAFTSGSGTASQIIQGYQIQANTTYTLDVLVGGRVDSSTFGFGGALIELFDATIDQVLASYELDRGVDSSSPVNGIFALQTTSFTTGQNDGTIGDSLGILLGGLNQEPYYPYAQQTWFDNVSVSADGASAVPEPSSLALFAIGGVGLAVAAYRRRFSAA